MPSMPSFNRKSAEQKAVERKADINRTNRHGTNMFFGAVESNNLSDVEKMIYEGADVNARTTARGFISNMTVNVPYGIGATPLHAACLLGSTDIVNLLIKKGADIHAKDDAGHTPLDYAILSHSYYQSDLENKSNSRFTLKNSLNKAASRVGMFENVITNLLARGAKAGMFEMPEKFKPHAAGKPPAPALP